MTGHETVSLTLRTPGGLPVAQALTFHQEGGFFTATITAVDVRSAFTVKSAPLPAALPPHLPC